MKWAILFTVGVFASSLMGIENSEARSTDISFGHVAVSVSNVEKAMSWYRDVLGFVIKDIVNVTDERDPLLAVAQASFGSNVKRLRYGRMYVSSNQGLELFEFQDPKYTPYLDPAVNKEAYYQQHRLGWLHLAIVTNEIQKLANKIVANGGKVVFDAGKKGVIFCLDPDGNEIELADHNWSAWDNGKEGR